MCYSNHHGMRGGCGYASKGMGHHGGHWARHHGAPRSAWFQPPVNIEELEDRYEIQLAAPGRNNADFQINVRGDILTISCGNQQGEDATASRWARHEYRLAAFERQFKLNDKIDVEGITARYADGILLVTLPKHPHAHTPAKDIYVA